MLDCRAGSFVRLDLTCWGTRLCPVRYFKIGFWWLEFLAIFGGRTITSPFQALRDFRGTLTSLFQVLRACDVLI